MSLEVVPHELPIIGAQIDATRAGVDAVLGAAQPIAQPGLHSLNPAADMVSQYITGVRALYSGLYFTQTTNPGVGHLSPGRDALVQSAADYLATDGTGGETVSTAVVGVV